MIHPGGGSGMWKCILNGYSPCWRRNSRGLMPFRSRKRRVGGGRGFEDPSGEGSGSRRAEPSTAARERAPAGGALQEPAQGAQLGGAEEVRPEERGGELAEDRLVGAAAVRVGRPRVRQVGAEEDQVAVLVGLDRVADEAAAAA